MKLLLTLLAAFIAFQMITAAEESSITGQDLEKLESEQNDLNELVKAYMASKANGHYPIEDVDSNELTDEENFDFDNPDKRNYMRFGKRNYMRFGKRNYMRFGKRNYMRFGKRTPSSYLRFGK